MTSKHKSFMDQIAAAKEDAAKLRKIMGPSACEQTMPPTALAASPSCERQDEGGGRG